MHKDKEICLFNGEINNWQKWSEVFQCIPLFSSLVEFIFTKKNLPFSEIKHLTPGTNAVFKVGNNVIKIFAPIESGIDQTLDLQTELFAIRRIAKLGISAPKLIAEGIVKDKYHFAYMITEYINGAEFSETVKTMTDDEKMNIGRKLRTLTDAMNTPCDPFNNIDVINDKDRYRRWNKYTEKFKEERIDYIKSHSFGEKVFVHGDLCGDNILLSPNGEVYIIDFADAVLAPTVYEQALVAVELFNFDKAFLHSYFENYSTDELIELCFNGILIHDFGGDIVDNHIGRFFEIDSLSKLKEMLVHRLQNIT
jgi:tRNA A-37 threonylcarbamoyl transferase component Bud32